MFGGKRRMEEDLERIRRANLPPAALAAEEFRERADKEAIRENLKDVGPKQIFSMTIAVFSIVLPYLGGFVALLLAFWLVIRLMAGSS